LKNILGEIDGSKANDDVVIAPKTHVSIKKVPTTAEIEAKKYMEKFNKKKIDQQADVSIKIYENNVNFE
jgi:hypothetical protein